MKYTSYLQLWIYVPYFFAWIYAWFFGIEVNFLILLLMFVPITLTYFLLMKPIRKFAQSDVKILQDLSVWINVISVIFGLLNLLRVFGTLSPVGIASEYLSYSLRAIEYRYGGSPIINNLHMLSAFATSLNLYFMVLRPKLGRAIILFITLFFTLLIPIKTLIVESVLLAFVLTIFSYPIIARKYVAVGITLVAVVVGIDTLRIFSDNFIRNGSANVIEAIIGSFENIGFYFAGGFLNFTLVLEQYNFFGNQTVGTRLFAPLLDIVSVFFGDRILERGYTGKTGIDGLTLPEIKPGVNIYTCFLSPFLDFGVGGLFILPSIFWIFLLTSRSIAKVSSGSGTLFYCLFLSIVLPSFAWSLKLFYVRLILFFVLGSVFFLYKRSKYG